MSNSAKGFGTSIRLLSSDQVVKVQRVRCSDPGREHKLIGGYIHADNSCYRYFVLDHRLFLQVLCAWDALTVDSPTHPSFHPLRCAGIKHLLGSVFSSDHPCELRIEQTMGKTH